MTSPRHPVPRQVAESRRSEWLRMLTHQAGLVSRQQLTSFLISDEAIRSNIRGGRWRAVLPRVFATFTGPLTREAQIAAALLCAGPVAVLSHRTAAEFWGMRPAAEGPVHVTVPYNCSAVSHTPHVVVHRSRAFRHITVDGDPPLTTRTDTAIDLAVEGNTARESQKIITELVTGRRVVAAQVYQRLSERPPRRYQRALEQALDRLATGVESMLEELYAVDVEAAHGLPEAQRQTPVWVDGHRLFEDVTYDNVGVPLTVRLDGLTHLEPEVAYRDRRRDNRAEVAGRSRLVFGWKEVSDDPCGAASEVGAVFHRRGWQGPLRACPRCQLTPRE